VGGYCAQLEQYQRAIEIYEQVCTSSCICHACTSSLPTRLTRFLPATWMPPGWLQHDGQPAAEIQRQRVFLQSLPVSLHRRRAQRQGEFPPLVVRGLGVFGAGSRRVGSLTRRVSPQIAIEKYEEMFPAFSDSRECKLLKVRRRSALRNPMDFLPPPLDLCSFYTQPTFLLAPNRNFWRLTRNRTATRSQRR